MWLQRFGRGVRVVEVLEGTNWHSDQLCRRLSGTGIAIYVAGHGVRNTQSQPPSTDWALPPDAQAILRLWNIAFKKSERPPSPTSFLLRSQYIFFACRARWIRHLHLFHEQSRSHCFHPDTCPRSSRHQGQASRIASISSKCRCSWLHWYADDQEFLNATEGEAHCRDSSAEVRKGRRGGRCCDIFAEERIC